MAATKYSDTGALAAAANAKPGGVARTTEKRPTSCVEHIVSVKVLLPSTVALIVLVMAVTTITLFAVNTDKAVAGVVELLHDQVQGVVEGRILSHLDQVLTINLASARYFSQRPLGPPPGNQTPTNDADALARLDSVVTDFPIIDVHYIFHRNGRVIASLANDAATNLYAEEFYPDGLYFWPYPKGQSGSLDLTNMNRSAPALHVPDYVGYTRPYFTSQNLSLPYDYSWTNPYMVGPFLLFTNTITMIDERTGVFQGVMGADSYISTLTEFFTTLRPTERTKVFLADPTGLLVISTHGLVLTADGARIGVTGSDDATIAAAGVAMGDFEQVGGATARTDFKSGGDKWLLSYRRVTVLRAQLVVGVATPEDEFLGSVRATTNQTIAICVSVAGVGLLVIIAFCVLISRSLSRLQHNLDAVARLDLEDADSMEWSDTASAQHGKVGKPQGVFSELERTNESYVKLRNAIGAFRKYVPANVVHGLLSGSIQPHTSMAHAEVAVAFQDIVGFTTLCERNEPQVVVALVSAMFEDMTRLIMAQKGTVDKYIGDAIMSFWEIGHDASTTARGACENCVSVLLQTFSTARNGPEGSGTVSFRSGAHFGRALIGNFGSSTRFSYTVVGDTVNSAARLEPMNKETRTEVIVSGELMEQVADEKLRAHARYMGKINLIGKVGHTQIYQLTEDAAPAEEVEDWTAAVAAFEAGDYAKARERFAGFAEAGPTSLQPAAEALMQTAEAYVLQPPPPDLQGVRSQMKK